MGVGASVGLRSGVPELPRSGAGELGGRLLRPQLPAIGPGQDPVRPSELLPLPPVAPRPLMNAAREPHPPFGHGRIRSFEEMSVMVEQAPPAISHRFVPTATVTHCPYKGQAQYWSVRLGDRLVEDLAWPYRTTLPESQKIAGPFAFYNEEIDLFIDDQLQQRPVTKFSK